MAPSRDLIDPTNVAGINERARAWGARGEIVHPVRIDRIIVAEDAIGALCDEVRALAGSGRVLMVADRTPMRRGHDDLKALIEDDLARTASLTVRRLPDDSGDAFRADIETARRLADELAGFAMVVSVGSGSVTDVVKYARHLLAERTGRNLPLVCFPTAASVTAYTSASSVLTVDDVKRTLPSRLPEAVVCDLRTLADAPRVMTQAGFGDVLARSVAYGDWFLAAQLGMDDGFSEVPNRLLEGAERVMIEQAESVAGGELDGVRAVTQALLLAGMAMTLVNQTAPISGWEHVISHFLDLTARHDGRATALHGGQVGVGTLVAARAYERSWNELDVERLTVDRDDSAYRGTIEEIFGRYDSRGGLVDEVWRDYQSKLTRWRAAADARHAFVERYRAGEFADFLARAVRPASQIEDALRRAGAPRRFADLNEPVGHPSAHAAVRYGHLIRSRFTLGDLLTETGWLTDTTADGLLDDPGA
jgi:glycerol-1-phosphate dehydrogenase [NAD(P)+]